VSPRRSEGWGSGVEVQKHLYFLLPPSSSSSAGKSLIHQKKLILDPPALALISSGKIYFPALRPKIKIANDFEFMKAKYHLICLSTSAPERQYLTFATFPTLVATDRLVTVSLLLWSGIWSTQTPLTWGQHTWELDVWRG
jgi:hypothetical protein